MSERTDGDTVAGEDGHGGERLALRQVVGHAAHARVVVVLGEGPEETYVLYFVSEQRRQRGEFTHSALVGKSVQRVGERIHVALVPAEGTDGIVVHRVVMKARHVVLPRAELADGGVRQVSLS